MKYLVILSIFFLSACPAFTQVRSIEIHDTQYFGSDDFDYQFHSGHTRLNRSERLGIIGLIDSMGIDNIKVIHVSGHADSLGSHRVNMILSRKRAINAVRLLTRIGVPRRVIKWDAWGPDQPIADNSTAEGRYENRRVSLHIIWQTESHDNFPESDTADTTSIDDLYGQLAPPRQTFCINPNRDTILRCAQGTIIHIKAHSFPEVAGCESLCVRFSVKEDYLMSDIMRDRLTTTSDSLPLETQGMIYTSAVDCHGNKLSLQPGKELTILLPADSIRPDEKIFTGGTEPVGPFDWKTNPNARLASVKLSNLVNCYNLICGNPVTISGCGGCKFFFCRMGRLGKAIKGSFDATTRAQNQQFRQCVRNSRRPVTIAPPSRVNRLPIDTIGCLDLKALFKQYGVDNVDSLVKAMYKPLMDSFRLTSVRALIDTLKKIDLKKIEMAYQDMTISFDNFQYYVFNSGNLGWANCDCFGNYKGRRLATILVNIPPSPHMDVRLALPARRSMFAGTPNENSVGFSAPKGEPAVIVAIRYLDGKPSLAIKEIIVENATYDLDFRPLSLQELKTELNKLNRPTN